MDDPQPETDPWSEVSWEAHSLAQLRRMGAVPLWRKIELLEEMQRRFLHMQSSRLNAQKRPPADEHA